MSMPLILVSTPPKVVENYVFTISFRDHVFFFFFFKLGRGLIPNAIKTVRGLITKQFEDRLGANPPTHSQKKCSLRLVMCSFRNSHAHLRR